MKRGVFLFLFLVVISVVLLFWPGTNKSHIEVDVYSGTSAHRILSQLRDIGALRTRYPFLIWTKIRSGGSKIKVGRYRIREGRSAYWILDDMIHGRTQKIQVVIPEGFASWQIAERLHQNKICDGKKFLDVVKSEELEGFLYPATYDLDLGLDSRSVARVMKGEFDKRWTPDLDLQARKRGWTKKETVTFASIIEREVKVRDELPLISSLYNNRLHRNMRLEADPTVQYALGYWKSRLFYSDYRNTISPYNTYRNKGLPPGPICSPGMDAIRAALQPTESKALFMVAKEDGYHDFSETHREHQRKVRERNRRRKLNKTRG